MNNENIYKQAKKNYDKKSDFARKFNKDNNLKYGDEGYIDWLNMVTDLEREAKRLAQSLSNMSAYTVNNNVEGIESSEIKDCGWIIEEYTNRKERTQFMISVLQKELKRYKDLEFLTLSKED